MKKTILFILINVAFCSATKSQYRIDIGGLYGKNFYLGDSNPTIPFLNLENSYGGLIRFNANSRYSAKLHGYYGSLRGMHPMNNVILPNNVSVPFFSTNLWDVGLHLEYNFFPLAVESTGKSYYVTPYVFTGGGITILPGASVPILANIPFGLGVKWRLLKRITLGAEWGLRKTFTDNLESGVAGGILDDPYHLNESTLINRDYYSSIGIFATISLWKYKWNCGSKYMYE